MGVGNSDRLDFFRKPEKRGLVGLGNNATGSNEGDADGVHISHQVDSIGFDARPGNAALCM